MEFDRKQKRTGARATPTLTGSQPCSLTSPRRTSNHRIIFYVHGRGSRSKSYSLLSHGVQSGVKRADLISTMAPRRDKKRNAIIVPRESSHASGTDKDGGSSQEASNPEDNMRAAQEIVANVCSHPSCCSRSPLIAQLPDPTT